MNLLSANALKLSGLAGGSYLLSKIKPEWGQRVLCDNLKNMPGIPAKFSQWLERKWDLPSTTSLPLLSHSEVLEILKNEVPHFFDQIDFISEKAWPASIGQVHQVHLKNKTPLAVKIQYPGLSKEVFNQVDQLIWLLEKTPASQFGFDGATWRQELHSMFQEELNYDHELQNQQLFSDAVLSLKNSAREANNSWVLVPKVYPEWSNSKVLVQEWLEGSSLEEILNSDEEIKSQVSEELARVLIRSLLSMPLLHGDLQSKNWAWCSQRKKIILYDFGSCLKWDENKQKLFESLIINLRGNRDRSPFDYLVAFGFDRQKLLPINHQLPLLIENLLEPFWNPRLSKLSYWEVLSTLKTVLGEQSWYFRTAGPPWFLWLMRSYGNVFSSLEALNDRISFASLFQEEQALLEKSISTDPIQIPSQQDFVESNSAQWVVFQNKATSLRIQVKDHEEEIALLRFPIHLVNTMEDLINDDIKQKIKEQKLDLELIKMKALQSGLIQQDLIKITKDQKQIRVWIE